MIHPLFTSWDLAHKTVIVRIDGTIPVTAHYILDDHNLVASLATINYLLERDAQVIIITHIGNAQQAENRPSYHHLAHWFATQGITLSCATSVHQARELLDTEHHLILLSDQAFTTNYKPDQPAIQAIAQLGTYYVHDSFASLADPDDQLATIAAYFAPNHSSIGFLVDHELTMLSALNKQLKKPFSLIIGGIEPRKLAALQTLIPYLDNIYIGPAMDSGFFSAYGEKKIKSVSQQDLYLYHSIIMLAQEHNVTIHLPEDYLVMHRHTKQLYDSPLDELAPHEEHILSIGPKTAQTWSHQLQQAHTIVLYGLLGYLQKPESLVHIKELLQAMQDGSATTIITGSSTIAAAHLLGFAQTMNYCSTGGSSTLMYLAQAPLPGIRPLIDWTEAQQTKTI